MAPQQKGMCRACGYVGTKASMTKHQASCEKRQATSGKPREVFRLRVSGGGPFWLDIEAVADAKLDDIDRFLRGIWLECCGHLSEFTIGPEPDWADDLWEVKPKLRRGKKATPKLSEVLSVGQKFGYTYDMGSSTDLELTVQAQEMACGTKKVALLARNLPPVWKCSECDQSATMLNSWEYDEETGLPLMYCDTHVEEADEDALLPVVNSPRMGVCGYDGGNMDEWPPAAQQ
ncbi:MAG: hypothetical protein Q4C89_00215 [Deinococcus sp.]|uniref:hypothetical protein n=1 Tax=Deinococcus sp. TaxID=47478 RepID=UPI0026DC1069|nr:hypothetical protein [Deinococcus sp.]MDO4244433.1 hypothetical protein [Deinococcus sp.]